MSVDIYDPRFERCTEWIMMNLEHGVSCEQIKQGKQEKKEDVNYWLGYRVEDDFWPVEVREEGVWSKLVDLAKSNYDHAQRVEKETNSAIIHDEEVGANVTIPLRKDSLWQQYKSKLLYEKHFENYTVINIEKECFKTLKRLSNKTSRDNPVRGMVVGNVQSGKTANMAGLIAMAGDYRWNIVIVLTGTIEILRKQTQERLIADLSSQKCMQQIISVDNPKKGDSLKASNFGGNNKVIALVACLKVKSRLMNLIDWLQEEPSKVQNYRILIIDDEADQASINTADVYDDEVDRKTINRLICNLVFCRSKNAKNEADNKFNKHYEAMNYVCYTATPYANLLNESWDESLYPHSFIHTLSVSDDYIGPKQLFNSSDAGSKSLNIVRVVDKAEIERIKEINKGPNKDVPSSFQESILWFICCVATMRYRNIKKPFSLLIHTDMKKNAHKNIDDALFTWFKENTDNIVSLCKHIYERETSLYTLADFKSSMPYYSHSDKVLDYVPFEELVPYIKELAVAPTRIKKDEDAEKRYSKAIHVCVDNSGYKKNPVPEDEYIRLSYPSDEENEQLGFATAFIVIGGNTLSRGLTLKGLVSTYFLRTSKQADSLMQMARWFGYRKGYELYPRIWISQNSIDSFEYLYELDDDLRSQIARMSELNISPDEYMLTMKRSPYASFLLTAKNKMQMAVVSDVDYSGATIQLVIFQNDKSILDHNIKVTEDFLSKLGDGKRSERRSNAYYWENVDFEIIRKNFFNSSFKIAESSRAFQDIDALSKWISESTEKGEFDKWTVIIAGKDSKENDPSKDWVLPNGERIRKVERSKKQSSSFDSINIGTLVSKSDLVADLTASDFTNELVLEEFRAGKNNISTTYSKFRDASTKSKCPLLMIYRVDKDSSFNPAGEKSDRVKLEAPEDLLGFAFVFPGIRKQANTTLRVRIKRQDELDNED